MKNLKKIIDQQDTKKVGDDKEGEGWTKAIVKKHGSKEKPKAVSKFKGIEKLLEEIESDSPSDSDDSEKKPRAVEPAKKVTAKGGRKKNAKHQEKFDSDSTSDSDDSEEEEKNETMNDDALEEKDVAQEKVQKVSDSSWCLCFF